MSLTRARYLRAYILKREDFISELKQIEQKDRKTWVDVEEILSAERLLDSSMLLISVRERVSYVEYLRRRGMRESDILEHIDFISIKIAEQYSTSQMKLDPLEIKRIIMSSEREIRYEFGVIDSSSSHNYYLLVVPKSSQVSMQELFRKNLGYIPDIVRKSNMTEYLLWLFEKYYYGKDIGRFQITDMRELDREEESGSKRWNHTSHGEDIKSSPSVLLSILNNRAITGLSLIVYDTYLNIEYPAVLYLSDYPNVPDTFVFNVQTSQRKVELPNELKRIFRQINGNYAIKLYLIHHFINVFLDETHKLFIKDFQSNVWEKAKSQLINDLREGVQEMLSQL